MRDVRPGDLVLHLTDNQAFTGRSIVASAADDRFIGVSNTEWADVPAYRVQLRDYTTIDPPLDRQVFFAEPYKYPTSSNRGGRHEESILQQRTDTQPGRLSNSGAAATDAGVDDGVQVQNGTGSARRRELHSSYFGTDHRGIRRAFQARRDLQRLRRSPAKLRRGLRKKTRCDCPFLCRQFSNKTLCRSADSQARVRHNSRTEIPQTMARLRTEDLVVRCDQTGRARTQFSDLRMHFRKSSRGDDPGRCLQH